MSDIESFRQFADLLPEAFLLLTAEGIIRAGNVSAPARLGRTVAELEGSRLADLVVEPADLLALYLRAGARSRQLVLGALTFVASAGESISCRCETAVFRPRQDDTPALLLMRLTPKETAIRRFIALNRRVNELTREITRRKEAEAALHEKSESLQVTLASIGDAVIATDARGDVTFLNPVAEALTGWTQAEAVGEPLERIFPIVNEQTRQTVESPVAKVLREGAVVGLANHTILKARDGVERPIDDSGAPIRGKQGEIHGVVLVFRDVSERRKTERTTQFLADASNVLAELVDYASTLQQVAKLAVPFFADWCTVDRLAEDGSVRRLAVAHVDPAKILLAEELMRRYPPDPRAERGVHNVLRTGQAEMMADIPDLLLVQGARDEEHLRILRQLGLRSYLCVPMQTRGKILGALSFVLAESGRRYTPADLAVAEDLAQRAAVAVENARLYEEMREADRRKTEFLATLAHELRNPLAPIRNGLQILRLAANQAETAETTRQMMDRQLGHLVRLIDDLLDISRITRGLIELRKERVELTTIVRSALEATRSALETAGHELTLTLPNLPLELDGDPTRLTQVVSNLLNNAVRYTSAGGRIGLTVERQGEQAVVRVRDSGLGIPAEMLSEVFEMFTQINRRLKRSQGGLGIGLALVQNLIRLHGGSVEAHSEGLDKGSEFIIRLPVAAEEEAPSQTDTLGLQASPSAALRILVVDDNTDAADSLALLLRIMNHEVAVAHDGPSGIELARRQRPDLIFLDIGLPGMSGYEVASLLRQEPDLAGVTLVALTGWGQPEDRRRSQEAGFDEHLVKPADPEVLGQVLKQQKPRRES